VLTWAPRRSASGQIWRPGARLLCAVASPVGLPSVATPCILTDRSPSLTLPGLARRLPPSERCVRSSGSISGTRGRCAHHCMIRMWCSCLAPLCSAGLWLCVLALDMDKVKLRAVLSCALTASFPSTRASSALEMATA
jgi:hypothetical protein